MTTVPAPTLGDLFGAPSCDCIPSVVEQAIADGYVRRQVHPTEPLAILNYSHACQWEKAWTDVTMTCRGLVYRTDTGEIVARSWRKFFNVGEPLAPTLAMDARTVVTDKLDGSLGICVLLPSGGHVIATRGSFMSEQAKHATAILRNRYADWAPPAGVTVLFEVIFKANRIVVDYGDLDDLVFLGAVETATGRSLPQDPALYGWPGPAVTVFDYPTLADALAAPPRDNAEGLVVHFVDTDQRAKIKQSDYVAMHRVLTGTSARTLWQYLAVNACQHLVTQPKHWGTKLGIDHERAEEILAVGPDWLDTLMSRVPDEFYDWAKTVIGGLTTRVDELGVALRLEADVLVGVTGGDRRQFAEAVAGNPHMGALFLLLDGRGITTYLWKQAYPPAGLPWMTVSEDTA